MDIIWEKGFDFERKNVVKIGREIGTERIVLVKELILIASGHF